jgi:hypothetical protein
MPYVVLPVVGGYKVFRKGTTKSFSNHPLTKKMAEMQKKAIEYHEFMGRRDYFLNLF